MVQSLIINFGLLLCIVNKYTCRWSWCSPADVSRRRASPFNLKWLHARFVAPKFYFSKIISKFVRFSHAYNHTTFPHTPPTLKVYVVLEQVMHYSAHAFISGLSSQPLILACYRARNLEIDCTWSVYWNSCWYKHFDLIWHFPFG